jgi:Zn-finger nucleic acid-binding protein
MEEMTAENDMVLQRCGQCEGLWTDVAELNRLLLHHNFPGLEALGGRSNVDDTSGKCPVCLVDMVIVEGGPRHSMRYETCEVCGGVWIQPEGEVHNVKEAIGEIVGFFKDFKHHAA